MRSLINKASLTVTQYESLLSEIGNVRNGAAFENPEKYLSVQDQFVSEERRFLLEMTETFSNALERWMENHVGELSELRKKLSESRAGNDILSMATELQDVRLRMLENRLDDRTDVTEAAPKDDSANS